MLTDYQDSFMLTDYQDWLHVSPQLKHVTTLLCETFM